MLLLPLSQSPGADARRSLFLLVSSGTSRLTIRFAKWMAWLKTVLSSCCTSSCWVDLLRVGQRRSCSAAKSIAVFSWCWPSGSLTQNIKQNKSRVNTYYCMCVQGWISIIACVLQGWIPVSSCVLQGWIPVTACVLHRHGRYWNLSMT